MALQQVQRNADASQLILTFVNRKDPKVDRSKICTGSTCFGGVGSGDPKKSRISKLLEPAKLDAKLSTLTLKKPKEPTTLDTKASTFTWKKAKGLTKLHETPSVKTLKKAKESSKLVMVKSTILNWKKSKEPSKLDAKASVLTWRNPKEPSTLDTKASAITWKKAKEPRSTPSENQRDVWEKWKQEQEKSLQETLEKLTQREKELVQAQVLLDLEKKRLAEKAESKNKNKKRNSIDKDVQPGFESKTKRKETIIEPKVKQKDDKKFRPKAKTKHRIPLGLRVKYGFYRLCCEFYCWVTLVFAVAAAFIVFIDV